MTLAEIFVQLPAQVAVHLEALLEKAELPGNPSREEISEAASIIVTKLRYDVNDPQTLELLDKLPQAILDQLY